MSAELKPTPVSSAANRWKPKPDFPATKAPPSSSSSSAAPQKRTYYKEECFPWGGEEKVAKKSRNRNKKKPYRLNWGGAAAFKRESYTPEQLYGGQGVGKGKRGEEEVV